MMRYWIIPLLVGVLLAEQNQCGEERPPQPPDAGDPALPDVGWPDMPVEPGDGGRDGGGGGGNDSPRWDEWDGGDSGRDGGAFPGSGIGDDPGTDVLYFADADVALANLGAPHEKLVGLVNQALHDAGLRILSTRVFAMNAHAQLWAQYAGMPRTSLAQTLAAQSLLSWSDGSGRCPVSTLWEQRYAYSGYAGSALLVVFLDTSERLASYDSAACWLSGGGTPVNVYGASDSGGYHSRWPPLPALAVRFMAIRSPEDGTTTTAWRKHCLERPTFPKPAVDVIATSSSRFYEPFFSGLNTRWQRGHAFDYCTAAGDDSFKLTIKDYSTQWVSELKAFAGVP